VRQPSLAPYGRQQLQQGRHVLEALLERHRREVDDDTHLGKAEGPLHVSEGRRPLLSQDEHAWKGLERRVVPLGVDHADAVGLEDQLLTDEPRHPGLARAGVAGDEHVPAPNG